MSTDVIKYQQIKSSNISSPKRIYARDLNKVGLTYKKSVNVIHPISRLKTKAHHYDDVLKCRKSI